MRTAFLLAALLSVPVPGHALAIVPVQDDRSVAALGQSATPSPPFSPFNAFVGGVGAPNASQDSSVGTTGMSGSGNTGRDGGGSGPGSTVFDLTFQVDEPAVYSLAADGFFGQDSHVIVKLLGPGGALYEPALTTSFQLADTGTLDPGADYRLVIAGSMTDTRGLAGARWNFTFGIEPVPEPHTALLVALGLIGLAAARRK
jgi:PEP-CTERM motif-containing protein